MLRDGVLGAAQFVRDETGRSEAEQRMSVAVIADLVPGVADLARDGGQPRDIGAALKKCRRDIVPGEDVEQLRRAFAGAVVKGQRDRRGGGAGRASRTVRTPTRSARARPTPGRRRRRRGESADAWDYCT